MSLQEEQRLDYISALRGLCALCVVVSHIADKLDEGHVNPYDFFRIFDLGRFGVVVFFMISGFVVPFSIKGKRPLYGFVIGRIFRIYPAYWLSCILAYLFFLSSGVQISLDFFILNFAMLQKLFNQPDLLPVYWTLSYEILFYIACAGLYYAGVLYNKYIILAVAAIGVIYPLLSTSWFGQQSGLISGLLLFPFSFMALGIAFRLQRMKNRQEFKVYIAGISLIVLMFDAGKAFIFDGGSDFDSYFRVLTADFLSIIIFSTAHKIKIINMKILLDVGVWSYSLYLLHQIFIDMMTPVLLSGSIFQRFIISLLMMAFSISAAILSYKYIERPSIALGRRLRTQLCG